MAIEVVPKTKTKSSFWPIVFFIVCLFLLLIFSASYIFFIFSSKKMEEFLKPTLQEQELRKGIETKEKELILAKKQIDAFGYVLSEHQNARGIFDLLEKLCLPNVWFNNFNFSAQMRQVTISGLTDSFVSVGQQIIAFKQEPLIKNVNLTGVSLGKEGIVFSLSLILDPQVFK